MGYIIVAAELPGDVPGYFSEWACEQMKNTESTGQHKTANRVTVTEADEILDGCGAILEQILDHGCDCVHG